MADSLRSLHRDLFALLYRFAGGFFEESGSEPDDIYPRRRQCDERESLSALYDLEASGCTTASNGRASRGGPVQEDWPDRWRTRQLSCGTRSEAEVR